MTIFAEYIMKKFTAILLTLCCIICSCSKQGKALFKGSYSFKTGGSVEIIGEVLDILKDTVKVDTIIRGFILKDTTYRYHVVNDTIGSHDTSFLRSLIPEKGQLHIVENGADSVLVTMNITGGDPLVFRGAAEGDLLILLPAPRTARLESERLLSLDKLEVSSSGKGHRYENVLYLEMNYAGNYNLNGFEGRIHASRINCVATENE